MHPDETPRQAEARQPDDPHSASTPAEGFGAGECGDAIWEASAGQGGTVGAIYAPQPEGLDAAVRGGRFIDLVERRPRREQPDG